MRFPSFNSKMGERTFILDNGGSHAKVGFSTDEKAQVLPNCIMKAKNDRRRTFISKQLDECRDASGLYYVLPFQKGYLQKLDVQKTIWDYIFSKECCSVDFNRTPLIVTEPLFNFPYIQEAMLEIFFEEYECNSLVKINPSTLAFYKYKSENPLAKCCIVVDVGFSFTHVVPYINNAKIKEGIRRIDVGGKLLTNRLKDNISYRQLDVSEETYVVNQAKEDACFVSQDFYQDMETAKAKTERNPIVKDYVLPDFVNNSRGVLTDPGPVEARQRVRLSHERFTIPEILFYPSDVGIKQMGIPEAIVDCLKACNEETWGHLLTNIVIVGGSAKFPGFKDRVLKEVRSLSPDELEVKVFMPEDPQTYAWEGGKLLSNDSSKLHSLTVTRKEYEEGHTDCNDKFDI